MPPRSIWSVRGGDAKISTGEKLSLRMMVVLTVRSNGDKLPIFFVIRGTPGVRIDTAELQTCPSGHFYAVQAKAWMDNIVWKTYFRGLLQTSLTEPSVVRWTTLSPT
ncbi:hypothetical protein AaE_011908 [Aphanomyces astaci]|uniref:DDE-1 domain-containing protein n=1 Tax=Aphanomyces astaci TaxID=112090 RepID=A0A6A4ZV33_APHAT|nr:hypothetical protein AaE_011908 [Aphanomyces astaci]